MKKILIVSQEIQKQFYDVMEQALEGIAQIDIITANKVKNDIWKAPDYHAESLKTRFISWMNFFLFMQRWRRKNKKGRKYDLIFVSSNPPINIWIGLRLKKDFQAPVIFTHWDIYPQAIECSIDHYLSHIVCKLWRRWNHLNYKKYDLMLANGPAEAELIEQSVQCPIRIKAMPFGVDTRLLKPLKKEENIFCIENGLTEKFVVLYSGTMGIGHNIEIVLKAARKLEKIEDILFVFVGQGVKRQLVEKYVARYPNKNVRLFPFQSVEKYVFSMACGDVAIVAQNAENSMIAYPSKAFSFMACGEALVGIGGDDGDLKRLICTYDVGVYVENNDASDLAEKIFRLYQDKELVRKYRENARKTAEEVMDIRIVKEKYRELFLNYLGGDTYEQ